jgi:hypothetical protein
MITVREAIVTKPKEGELLPKYKGKGTGLDAPGKKDLRDRVAKALAEQHPMASVFGVAFEQVGGVERLIDWAEENYTEFIRTYTKFIPTTNSGGGGKTIIQINNNLKPTELDE